MPTALITGVSGQDGSYLAEFLLSKDYEVIGTTRDARRALERPYARALARVDLVEVTENPGIPVLVSLIEDRKPDEIYHLGGPSRVSTSWNDPTGTMVGIVLPVGRMIEVLLEMLPAPRLFVAGSSEVFAAQDHAQDESAPHDPQSPYAVAKNDAADIVRRARDYGLYATTGILYNHESPRRGADFVTGKIARAAARISKGLEREVRLGNIENRRDWGFAGDYVRAMWLMQFQEEPEDLVIGTGIAHSVAEFCEVAFRRVGLDWKNHVVSDPSLLRPTDAPLRLANPARAKSRLGWTPEVNFEQLVEMMVEAELEEAGRE